MYRLSSRRTAARGNTEHLLTEHQFQPSEPALGCSRRAQLSEKCTVLLRFPRPRCLSAATFSFSLACPVFTRGEFTGQRNQRALLVSGNAMTGLGGHENSVLENVAHEQEIAQAEICTMFYWCEMWENCFGKLGDFPPVFMKCIWLFTPSSLLEDLLDATNMYSINIAPGRYLKNTR